jgi:hypothetical protein
LFVFRLQLFYILAIWHVRREMEGGENYERTESTICKLGAQMPSVLLLAKVWKEERKGKGKREEGGKGGDGG